MPPRAVPVKEHGKCSEKEQTATFMTAKPRTSLLFSVRKVLHNVCIFHKSHSSTSKAAAWSCMLCPDDFRGQQWDAALKGPLVWQKGTRLCSAKIQSRNVPAVQYLIPLDLTVV